jgi:uncharacterized phiE125 gp8 family phage protein
MMVTAARLECETINDRSFVATQWRLTLDYLPFASYGGLLGPAIFGFPTINPAADDGSIYLPMPPLISLDAISYVDQAGTTQMMDVTTGGNQVVTSLGTPGRIAPAFNTFFPFSRPTISAVNIDYTAGYGSLASAVPMNIVLAILMLTSHYYEHRTTSVETPQGVFNLLNATRWGGYA